MFCENDANCFALSESIDGAGKHYKIVYGIILGSGVGGGLVIDKRIVSGPNGVAGENGVIIKFLISLQRKKISTQAIQEKQRLRVFYPV